MTMHEVPLGYMKNATGALIPEAQVKPEDKLEDELVQALLAQAQKLATDLSDFKAQAFDDILAFKEMIAEQYGAQRGGAKGNMTLSTFDGSAQVQFAVSELIDLHGSQILAAKELIDNCVTRWSEGANDQIKALVDHAFQVGKEGKIDTQRVLGLTRLDIEDEEWTRAMEAIREAVRVTATRNYIRFYVTDPKSGIKTPVSLDFAKA